MKIKLLNWKRDFKGRTYVHEATTEMSDTQVGTIAQLAVSYVVTCLDTGRKAMTSELRNVNPDTMELDLTPSWPTLNELRERL